MSSKRSRHGSDHSSDERRKRSESPVKSKWESPPDDRRRKRSRDRDSRRHHEDRHRSREDHRRSPNERRHRRESPEPSRSRKRNESPDNRRHDGSREKRDERRRDEPDRRRRNSPEHSRRRNDDDSWKNRKNQRKYDEKEYNWGKSNNVKEDPDEAPVEKEKPNFGLSGALAKQTNTVAGVEVKYAEPPEARKPKRRWRLYQFKGEQSLPVLHIHRQSAYLIGRDRKICDMPIDHPSASKQHAVLQYRLVKYETEDGRVAKRIRPYIIDLNSSNGTFLNNAKIDPSKYYELMEKDVLKFAFSSREYVLLHERSKDDSDDGDDDDNVVEEEKPAEEAQAETKTSENE